MQTHRPNCIYCGRFFSPSKGEGDHVLPSALFGEFVGDRRFRGLCTSCNNRLGCYEQVLGQSSQFGFYRQLAKPNLGRKSKRGVSIQRGAHGSPAPKFVMKRGENSILVRPSPGEPLNASPANQLVVHDSNGDEHHVELFPNMRAEQLRNELRKRGLEKARPFSAECDAQMYDDVVRLVSETYANGRVFDREELQPGTYRLPGRIEFRFSVAYWQAIAKIAFHYYLVHNRRGFTGREPFFAPLRRFILYGGDPGPHFAQTKIFFADPFGPDGPNTVRCPSHWCHLLAANENSEMTVVYLRLYVGPGAIPRPIYVTLGKSGSRILLPFGAFGHIYQIEPERDDRFAGTISRARLFPLPN